MAQYKRLQKSTISKYMRNFLDGVAEMRYAMYMLKKKGNIKTGCAGLDIDTPVLGGKYTMTGHNDGESIVYSRKNHLERATFDWAEYVINDFITDGEKLKNRGSEALFDAQKSMVKRMKANYQEELGKEFLTKDGPAETSFNALNGLPSFASGSYSSGKEATPNDTYGGISTAPNAATDIDNQLPDFWSPNLVAWNKDEWGNSSALVSDNILDAMRYACIHGQKGNSRTEQLDCFLLSQTDYFNMVGLYEDKEEIQVVKDGGAGRADLGFDAIRYYGKEVSWDADLSSGTGWGLNYDHIHLFALNEGNDLIDVITDYNSEILGDTLAMVFRGQVVVQPKFQVKLGSY